MRDFENERAVLSLILLDGALEDEPLNDGAGEAPQQIVDGREFGAGRHQPPQVVDAEGESCVVEEILLLTVLLLPFIHVALIVIYGRDLLLKEIKGEVCEK